MRIEPHRRDAVGELAALSCTVPPGAPFTSEQKTIAPRPRQAAPEPAAAPPPHSSPRRRNASPRLRRRTRACPDAAQMFAVQPLHQIGGAGMQGRQRDTGAGCKATREAAQPARTACPSPPHRRRAAWRNRTAPSAPHRPRKADPFHASSAKRRTAAGRPPPDTESCAAPRRSCSVPLSASVLTRSSAPPAPRAVRGAVSAKCMPSPCFSTCAAAATSSLDNARRARAASAGSCALQRCQRRGQQRRIRRQRAARFHIRLAFDLAAHPGRRWHWTPTNAAFAP